MRGSILGHFVIEGPNLGQVFPNVLLQDLLLLVQTADLLRVERVVLALRPT